MTAERNSIDFHDSASLSAALGTHFCRLTPQRPPPGSARTA